MADEDCRGAPLAVPLGQGVDAVEQFVLCAWVCCQQSYAYPQRTSILTERRVRLVQQDQISAVAAGEAA